MFLCGLTVPLNKLFSHINFSQSWENHVGILSTVCTVIHSRDSSFQTRSHGSTYYLFSAGMVPG